MEFRIQICVIHQIPLMEIYKSEETGPKPLVLLYHGYFGQKEFLLAQAYHLANYGFFVVMPNAWGHGERHLGTAPDFFEAIAQSSAEINGLIEAYDDDERTDNKRCGLTGFSMGECIVYEYLAAPYPMIKAAVPIIATPDWVSIMSTQEAEVLFRGNVLLSDQESMDGYICRAQEV